MTDAQVWKEQTAFERLQWDYKASGIILLALEEPDMPRCLIADRFSESKSTVEHLLQGAGIYLEPDYFAASIDGKRRMVA